MKPEPSLPEKIADLIDPQELDGFAEQLCKTNQMTPRLENLIALRREEMRKK
ncbi:MAG: hypothetical protein ACRC14_04820 [Paracoccaceae bacterium]